MAITKVINDAVDLNQTSDYSGLRLPVGTTGNVVESFTTDYLVVGGGGGTGTDSPGGGGGGGLRTSYNNSTTTTNTLSFPSGKTAIATYMLDNNATDISGNHNGTETNITYNTGKYGGGAVFNGSNSSIFISSTGTSVTDYDQDFSISFWFNFISLNASYSYNVLFTGGGTKNIQFLIDTTNGARFQLYNGTIYYVDTGAVSAGNWYHVVATRSKTNGLEIYLNGISKDTNSFTGNSSAISNKDSIGSYWDGTRNSFNGSIDQVRIYDTALSGTDVTNIYNNEVQALSGGGIAAESSLTLTEGVAYDVTVGNGGTKAAGSNSVFSNIISDGGGAGGGSGSSAGYNGGNGGSGGGASGGNYSLPGGNGTTAQGYAGGGSGSQAGAGYPGGGGGGASAKGQTLATSSDNGGTGGDGVITNILNSTNATSARVGEVSGSNVYYSGGGGGSTYTTTLGTGGLGGGADGQKYIDAQTTNDGTANTGGGGGAQNSTGGSGVVILRYPTAGVASFTVTGTLNTPSTTDTLADNNYPTTNLAYYKLDGNANGILTTNDLGTFDYPSGTGCIALYELNGNANGYLTTTDLSTVNYPAGAGCIALYEMNGNATDTSNTYNGSATDVTYNTGAFDQAAVFNGTSSKIGLDPSISSTFTDSFTFSAWVYPTDNSNYICLFSAQYGMELYFYQGEFSLYSNDTNTGSSRNIQNFATTTTNYAINQWHHVALVFTKTSQTWYINGQQDGTNTTSSYTPYQSSLISIGYFDGSTNHYVFNGLIDQVRVFNTALSAANITTLARGVGSSYSGVETNITYDTGAFGKAAVFNGSNSYIQTSLDFDTLTNYTISIWIKPSASGKYFAGTVSASTALNGMYLNIDSGNTIRFFERNGSGSATSLTSTDTVTLNAWNHIVAVRDGSTNYLYINNGTPVSLSNSTITHATDFTIGRAGAFTSSYFEGSLDQVRIFDTALSASNVATLARGVETAYNGAESNVTWANGRFGQAAAFYGSTSSYISLPTGSPFDDSDTIKCISAWIKPNISTSRVNIFSISSTTDSKDYFVLNFDNGNSRIQLRAQNGSSSNRADREVSITPTTNWVHVVAQVTASTTEIYLNGVQQTIAFTNNGSATDTSWISYPSYSTAAEGRLGLYRISSPLASDGSIDQVRIFGSALSASNITDLYKEHYQTKFTDGSDTAILFTEGTGTLTFSGVNPAPPQGALRTNTSYSEDGSGSAIEHYNGTEWKYFDAIKYCTTNTLNFPPGAGCIASYNLNNNVDDIGNTYNGVNSAVTFNASGKFGAAAVFNGSSSKIEINSPIVNVSNDYTVSMWVNASDVTTFTTIYENINTDGYLANQALITILNGTIRMYVAPTSGSSTIYSYNFSGASLSVNTWYHLVFVVKTNSNHIAYIDGTPYSSTYLSSTTSTPSGFTTIGYGNTNYFDGSIDQVRIFNSALSSTQVGELYNNEIACS